MGAGPALLEVGSPCPSVRRDQAQLSLAWWRCPRQGLYQPASQGPPPGLWATSLGPAPALRAPAAPAECAWPAGGVQAGLPSLTSRASGHKDPECVLPRPRQGASSSPPPARTSLCPTWGTSDSGQGPGIENGGADGEEGRAGSGGPGRRHAGAGLRLRAFLSLPSLRLGCQLSAQWASTCVSSWRGAQVILGLPGALHCPSPRDLGEQPVSTVGS